MSQQVDKIKDMRPRNDVESTEGNAACEVPQELCPMEEYRYSREHSFLSHKAKRDGNSQKGVWVAEGSGIRAKLEVEPEPSK